MSEVTIVASFVVYFKTRLFAKKVILKRLQKLAMMVAMVSLFAMAVTIWTVVVMATTYYWNSLIGKNEAPFPYEWVFNMVRKFVLPGTMSILYIAYKTKEDR